MDSRRKEFEQIVDQYGEKLYRQIRRMVLNHDDAHDVLQNTFIKAWNGLPNFEGRAHLSSWLYRIAVNEALDFLRKKKQHWSLSYDDSEGFSIASRLMADEYFDGDETAAKLQQAIDELPHMQKLVFQLKYFEDKKYSEISEILGKSEGTLKASFHIAVKKISAFFEQND
ncbi:MAG: sigma-70 family RNA polymerase sigma factor [Bacteroidales bacterium]|nr:sigma-70 family RNA polymerase sigma factor [Bacteroidales bacterium]MCM1148137.1 sigma-70 family RNA polymerase sigma factor [Bacteroidales bacterium]MCM1206553.1 sigma-70 family RNA polymerase sigma factor [Bacillota bacterium]MCM1510545.1 sigma-70 family RNA polymerase sigma factor [Clostridium sp.]